MNDEILFTVGPVQMYPDSLEVGGRQLPYFRTEEFSRVVLDCEKRFLGMVDAPPGSRCAFLTMSGSGAMEAVLVNAFGAEDRLLVVNGGTFGHRFIEICDVLGLAYEAIDLAPGTALTEADLRSRGPGRFTGLLINAHETSTGVLYDLAMVGRVCREHGLFLVVDAISAFLCDPLSMETVGIDVLITSSQKALALAPGLSLVALSPRGVTQVGARKPRSLYMDIARHLADGVRGQTPFTPAVGVILQLQARLEHLGAEGDMAFHVSRAAGLASAFRGALGHLPVRLFAQSPSNALTSLAPTNGQSAYEVFLALKDRHGLVVTPNGGPLSKTVFRVGHMGNLGMKEYERLVKAMGEVLK